MVKNTVFMVLIGEEPTKTDRVRDETVTEEISPDQAAY